MGRRTTQLGISLSDRSVEIVEVAEAKSGASVVAAARGVLPAGVVEHGRITDQEKFVAALKQVMVSGKFSTRRAVFSLPDVVSFLHVFRFPPAMTREEMKGALKLQAEEVIPLSLAETLFDFVITEHNNDHVDVLYVAVARDALLAYRDAFAKAGMDLEAVSTDASSLSRLVSLNKESKDAAMVVDIGDRTTTLLVVDAMGVRSSFTRFTAGAAMTEAVAIALQLDAQKAQTTKEKNGLQGDAKVTTVLQPFVERIGKDIVETIGYHEAHHATTVKEIVCVGGSSLMPGIVDALSAAAAKARPGVRVRLSDPWLVAKPSSKSSVQKNDGLIFAPAIGSALWGSRGREKEINLLLSARELDKGPKNAFVETSSAGQKVKLLFAVLFLLATILGLVCAYAHRGAFSYQDVYDAEEDRLAALETRVFVVPVSYNTFHLDDLSASEAVVPESGIVSDTDLARAEDIIIERVKTHITDYVGAALPPDELTTPSLIEVTKITTSSSPALGEPASEATVILSFSLDVLSVREDAIDAFVRRTLEDEGVILSDTTSFSYAIDAATEDNVEVFLIVHN